MIVDCHVHLEWKNLGGSGDAENILRAMDKAGVDKVFLFSPCPYEYEIKNYVIFKENQEKQGESIEKVAKIVAKNQERLIGFAWIDPLLPNAKNEVERAIIDYRLQGIKMIPNHWYPYEERIFPVYEKIEELKVPVIFHSGILHTFSDSSRFCRPTFYETLLHFPGIKFALAHMGWPWTDECIATGGRFRAAKEEAQCLRKDMVEEQNKGEAPVGECQMFIDITPGTPRIYRTEALRKALVYLSEDRLMYGTDATTTPGGMRVLKQFLERDKRIFSEELGLSSEAQEKIMGKNAMKFLK